MDIESLEAANQSLQADLKLAFKRIGDLQAAIEDEMESDDNEDLINRYGATYMCNWSWGLKSLFSVVVTKRVLKIKSGEHYLFSLVPGFFFKI